METTKSDMDTTGKGAADEADFHLGAAINNVLIAATSPMTTAEIRKIISAATGHPVHKADINRHLYNFSGRTYVQHREEDVIPKWLMKSQTEQLWTFRTPKFSVSFTEAPTTEMVEYFLSAVCAAGYVRVETNPDSIGLEAVRAELENYNLIGDNPPQ